MAGMDAFMWRSALKWTELIAVAGYVLDQWNVVTRFIAKPDMREHIWTVRHESVSQPFLVLNGDSLHGSLPRTGNPLPLLLLIGMVRARPGCMAVSFANGQKIDLSRFEPADLTSLLPLATHPAHRKLADISCALSPMPSPAGTTGISVRAA